MGRRYKQLWQGCAVMVIVGVLAVAGLPGRAVADGTNLGPGQSLGMGGKLTSPDGHYALIMQTDGNVVDYAWPRALWASNTANHPGSDLEMQTDGNLVVYAPGHIAVWATGTFSASSALLGQTDGNFVLYAPGNRAVWATNANTVQPSVPASAPATLTSCPTMRQGSAGSCVLLLQQSLNSAGASPVLTPDGNFGPLTRQAVVNYQTSRGLSIDGVAGPQTLQALAAHKPPVSAPPASHNYPASFSPHAAASWAVANALVPIPVPQNWVQLLFTGDEEPCTTFVSWALAKGGMPEDADWFPFWDAPSTQHSVFLYMSSDNPVPAWYAANNFVSRFVSMGWAAQRQLYPNAGATAIAVGDVIYYQWDGTPNHPHLALVTQIANGQVYVTDQGGSTLYPSSINRPIFTSHTGASLITTEPHMKVFVIHWQ